jgi:hypothetical protein
VNQSNANAALLELSPDALKARFKALCLETNNVHQNWQIRVHRSLSWCKRATQFGADQPEAKYLFLWIALNALYGRWNAAKNAPDVEGHSRQELLRRVCEADAPTFGQFLRRHRGLVKCILGNPYLSAVFWRDPDHPKAMGWATEDVNYLDRNLKNGDFGKVLGQVLDRLFVLRGQIVHGASTGGSRLNRSSVQSSLQLLEQFVPLVQRTAIEHCRGDDWPALCYPPLGT